MNDRLDQIWGKFSQRADINLAGTNVTDTPRPSQFHGQAYEAGLSAPVRAGEAQGGADPVAAAFSALNAAMAAQDPKARPKAKNVPPELAALLKQQPDELPPSNLEQTLFADLAFTRAKTERRDCDYLSFAAERQIEWQQRKRKKFLGLF